MERLSNTFGATAYKTERLEIIWREVQYLPDDWFKSIVDKFIGEERYAPMLDKFREEVSKQREASWQEKKKVGSQEAEQFLQSYSNEDTKMLIQTILDRMHGKVSDEQYEGFLKSLHGIADSKHRMHYANSCDHCENTGIVFLKAAHGGEEVCKCHCVHGRARRENFPVLMK